MLPLSAAGTGRPLICLSGPLIYMPAVWAFLGRVECPISLGLLCLAQAWPIYYGPNHAAFARSLRGPGIGALRARSGTTTSREGAAQE